LNNRIMALFIVGMSVSAGVGWFAHRLPQRPLGLVAPSLSIETALDAARAATTACAGSQVSVSIIDASGQPKLFYVADGTAGNHAFMAFMKAHTALAFNMPSGKVHEMSRRDMVLAARLLTGSDFMTYAGGVTITKGSQIIGAIGVSGALISSQDEECALAALKSINAR
jgi:uncharacterized protein GlcG (DUF336 family)